MNAITDPEGSLAAAHLVRRRTATALLTGALIFASTTPSIAQDGCLIERGVRVMANIGPVAVSGRLVASIQHASWDTRPAVRVTVMGPFGMVGAGQWDAAWGVEDIVLDAATAIAAADFGLVSLDLSDPLYPVELDFIDLIGAGHLAVDNGFAYAAWDGVGGNGWFDIVEVFDPSDLQRRGKIYWSRPEPYWGKTAIDASDGIVVMSCYAGVVVIDVSDPWRPTERGVWTRNGSRDLALVNDVAVVAITSWVDPDDIGVEFIDLSDPDLPVSIGFWTAPSAVQSVAEYGGAIVAGTEADGVFLLDIDDPSHPVVLDHWQAPGLSVEHLATAWPTVAFSDSARGTVALGLDPSCLPPRQSSGRLGQ